MLRRDESWYSTPMARRIADNLLRYQSDAGGWPKNTNLAAWPPAARDADFATDGRANTFDNHGTTLPLRYLAKVFGASRDTRYRDAFDRGLDYTLVAQYPNGGWPQFYPPRTGYYSHVTFNDDAMINILALLRDIAQRHGPFDFVDAPRREQAARAVERGVRLILRTQLRRGDRLTAWCAQYDERTLAPAWARAYEPPSLSGNESVGILRFLMTIESPSRAQVAAIEGGVHWLETAAIHGVRVESFVDERGEPDRRVVIDATAPRLWARFYALDNDQPIFLGRDSVAHSSFDQIERERRAGYAYYGDWAESLLSKDYPAWKARLGR